jgi:antitoxin component HigA of HigAB toxin-antitoxin module
MEIHPIRNDDDHAAAVREIEKLWGAAPEDRAGVCNDGGDFSQRP